MRRKRSQHSLEDDDLQFDLHVLLALKLPNSEDTKETMILGGLVFEYFGNNNCGLLTYLAVRPDQIGKGVGRSLFEKSVQILDQNARMRGSLAGCHAIFMEVNPTVGDERSHLFLYRAGLRLLDFQYIQPPFSNDPDTSKYIILTVLLTDRIPTKDGEKEHYLPSTLVQDFVHTLWYDICNRIHYDFEHNLNFHLMMEELKSCEEIPVIADPWPTLPRNSLELF